jgi:hypothetical protein
MMRFMNIAVVAVLVLCILVQAPLVFAGGHDDSRRVSEAKHDVSGEEMVADLIFARPVGFVGLVFGTVAFVVALPFTLPAQQVNEAGKKLVVAPAKFTFVRPLGYK